MAATEQTIKQVNSLGNSEYKYGFSTELDEIKAPKGLSEEVVRFISAQKNEPDWICLLYTSPSPRDQRGTRMPSSA